MRLDGKTLEEISTILKITKERVRQIHVKAIQRLVESGKMRKEWLL